MSKKSQKQEETNILMFPMNRVVKPNKTALRTNVAPKNLEEIKGAVHYQKILKVNQVMEVLVPMLANGLTSYGINLSTEKEAKQIAFLIESLRSLLYKFMELNHPIQTIADELFEFKNGTFTIKDIEVKNTANN